MDNRADIRPARDVALLFPGQGAQQRHMARGLYRRRADFRDRMDEVFDAWGPGAAELRDDWLAEHPGVDLDALEHAQPLLFAVDWALGRTVLDWGVRPVALLGHSVGEVAAAALAGVFTLQEAAGLMADRVAQLADTPAGGMLAVHASAEQLSGYLGADVVVGAVNGPRQVLLAGPQEPLDAAERRLRADGFTCRRARAGKPFHSPALAAAAELALPGLVGLPLRPPQLPLHSAYRPGPMSARTATDPCFWARQPAAPVLFGPALDGLLAARDVLLLEAGPGQGLTGLARRHPAVTSGRSAVLPLSPVRSGDDASDLETLRAAAELLADAGHLT
ncbi:[acyl-carrier-protein] S-malonyltransferase [Kitasatospora sp. MAA4]|uniref:acyltransferase domain-containing protein n=1 Tax=Kitasatospora sp. MAA4 TaxID=3035093 RepID=UPI00247522B2|nr:acyltransferase domain-containing protein [Kitasatospora sp. MAA4]MDH6132412.1 [acyl-carrier-protein] S-malonyltransferase [Kitasatospora sp. MAA4]